MGIGRAGKTRSEKVLKACDYSDRKRITAGAFCGSEGRRGSLDSSIDID